MGGPNKPDNLTLNCGINNETWDVVIPILLLLLVLPSLLLNCMVAWICSLMRSSSSFMVYLKNLVAADIIMTLTIPITAANMLFKTSPGLQAFSCRFSSVVFYLAMNMGTVLMGLISLDRFLKIVTPGKRFFFQNLLFTRILTAVIWMVLIGSTTLPVIITTDQDPKNKYNDCMARKSKLGLSWHEAAVKLTEVMFWVTLILIVFCYVCITKKVLESYHKSRSSNSRAKTKTRARVFLILAIFFICFVPYHIVRMLYTELQLKNVQSCYRYTLGIVKNLTLWLLSTNICLDPLIYFFLCKALRQKILESCIYKWFPLIVGKNLEITSGSSMY